MLVTEALLDYLNHLVLVELTETNQKSPTQVLLKIQWFFQIITVS